MKTKCCFCEEYLRPRDCQYYVDLGREIDIKSRILFETKHWYAVPTLGCLTVGYVLLVCKQHYQSLSDLSIELYREMLNLKDLIENRIRERLGLKCVAFEHGSKSKYYSAANSVDHVHLHILPFSRTIWPEIATKCSLNDFKILKNYGDLFLLWRNNTPETYLLFQDLQGTIYYRSDAQGYPSQFFRKCLAPYLGVKEWDWRQTLYEENLIETIKILR